MGKIFSPEYELEFVIKSLFLEAITIKELNEWAINKAVTGDEIPGFMIELIDFKGFPKDIYKIKGIEPKGLINKEIEKTLVGIAYKRGINSDYAQYTSKTAHEYYEKNPDTIEYFKHVFFVHAV